MPATTRWPRARTATPSCTARSTSACNQIQLSKAYAKWTGPKRTLLDAETGKLTNPASLALALPAFAHMAAPRDSIRAHMMCPLPDGRRTMQMGEGLVLVSADHRGGGTIAGLDRLVDIKG